MFKLFKKNEPDSTSAVEMKKITLCSFKIYSDMPDATDSFCSSLDGIGGTFFNPLSEADQIIYGMKVLPATSNCSLM